MKGLFTLLAFFLFSHISQAQWQYGNSPSNPTNFKRGIERVGNELWVGTFDSRGLYRSLDGHTWFQATFFPDHLDIYDIYAESAISVLILSCDRDTPGSKMTVYRVEKVGKAWVITAKYILPVNCCSNIAKVFRADDLVVAFNESWDKLIAVNPDSTIAYNINASRFAFHAGAMVRAYYDGYFRAAVSTDNGYTWSNVYQTTQPINTVYIDQTFVWVALSSQKLIRITRSNGQVMQTVPPMDLDDLYLRMGQWGDSLTISTNFDWWYSMDAGVSWQMITDFQGPSDAFDVIEELPEWPVAFGIGNDLIRSDDAGDSWYKINAGIGAYSVLALERNGISTFLFAGVDNPAQPLYRSVNGGASWQAVTTPFTGHQFNDMQWMGAQSMFVLESNDLYFTEDQGQSWTQLSENTAFPATRLDGYFWKVFAQSPTAIQRYNVDGTFETTLSPAPATPANPICDFSPGPGEWFLQMQNGDFYFSTDEGESWTWRGHPYFGQNPLRLTRSGNNLIWCATDRVLYSTDQGVSWLPATFPGYVGALLSDVLVTNDVGSFAALRGLGVFDSPDDGATWIPRVDGLHNPDIYALTLLNNTQLFAGSHRGGLWNCDIHTSRLRGQVFLDNNQDGFFTTGDQPLSNVVVKATPSGQLATTDASGKFFFPYAPGQNDFISPVGLNGNNATVSPAGYVITQPSNNLRFAIANWPAADLTLHAASLDAFHTGQHNTLSLEYANKGVSTATGVQVRCVLPAGIVLSSATPMPDFVQGDTLTWQPAALAGDAAAKILLEISPDPGLTAGVQLRFVSTIQSDAPEADPSDNADIFEATLLGGTTDTPLKEVDRNILTLTEIAAGTPLEFTLRFQNTGAAEAHLLVITDLLDASLDPSTVELVGSSHPCAWKLTGTNKLTVTFPDLNLPPESDDPAGSRGYARFAVKARPDLALNTMITNQALLAFDFGQPFWSNTTQTKVQVYNPNDPLLNLGTPMGARPNPAVYYLKADWNFEADAPGRLTMTDAGGVVWVDLPVVPVQHDAQFDVTQIPEGAYVLFVDAGSRHFVRTVYVAHPDVLRKD